MISRQREAVAPVEIDVWKTEAPWPTSCTTSKFKVRNNGKLNEGRYKQTATSLLLLSGDT